MKTFKEFITEEDVNYAVGMSVKFDMTKTASYIEPDKLGGFDYGIVKSKSGDSYTLELPNSAMITVKGSDIISVGDGDVTPAE